MLRLLMLISVPVHATTAAKISTICSHNPTLYNLNLSTHRESISNHLGNFFIIDWCLHTVPIHCRNQDALASPTHRQSWLVTSLTSNASDRNFQVTMSPHYYSHLLGISLWSKPCSSPHHSSFSLKWSFQATISYILLNLLIRETRYCWGKCE